MSRARTRTLCAATLAALSIGVAGCGGSSSSSKEKSGASSKSGYGASYESSSTSSTAAQQPSAPAVVTTKSNPTFGTILADSPSKFTLYMFSIDHGGKSACYGSCAAVWIPLLSKGKPKAAGGAQAARLGTIKRTNGTLQVTYAGHPLYTYSPDKTPEDVTGQGVNVFGGYWYVMSASGSTVTKP